MLFFHSLPGSHVQPDHSNAVMNKYGIRLITPDRPGFGESDFQPGRTVRDWPADVIQLADALGFDRFSVVAISAGSPYVLACCVMIPDRIERAGIVIGVTPDDEAGITRNAVPAPLHWAVRRSRRISHVVHAMLVLGMRKQPDRALLALAKSLSEIDSRVLARPEVGRFIINTSLMAAKHGVQGWVYDDWLLNQPWGIVPSDISADTRVDIWWGDDDQATPLEHGRKLAAAIPGSKLHVLPGEGHFSIFYRFEEIFRELASQNGSQP